MPSDLISFQVQTSRAEETMALARELGRALRGGETIALEGDLGAGKTTFTRGLCEGIGFSEECRISSPTYVLEHIYPTRVLVHHYDAYRLSGAEEFIALGADECLRAGRIQVVEWSEKVASVLAVERLTVSLGLPEAPTGEGFEPPCERTVTFSGTLVAWGQKLENVRKRFHALKFRADQGDKR